MHDSSVEKYTLWLCPDKSSKSKLQSVINTLAMEFGSVPFSPHITTCPSFYNLNDRVYPKLQQIVRQFLPLTVKPHRLHYHDSFYQSFFIELNISDDLIRLNQATKKCADVEDYTSYFPHISLLYFDPKAFNSQLLCIRLQSKLMGMLTFNRICLMETSGSIDEWSCRREFIG